MGHRGSQSCSKTNSHVQTLRERISKTEKTPSVKRSFINSRRRLLGFKLKKVWLTKTNTSGVYQGLSSSNEDLSSWKRSWSICTKPGRPEYNPETQTAFKGLAMLRVYCFHNKMLLFILIILQRFLIQIF